MHKITTQLSFAAILLLTACGGAGTPVTVNDPVPDSNVPTGSDVDSNVPTGSDVGTGVPTGSGVGSGVLTVEDLDTILATTETFASNIDNQTFEPTTASGSASYDGFIAIAVPNDTNAAVGNLSVSVDFDGGAVTGSAGDFAQFIIENNVSEYFQDLPGTLNVAGNVAGSSLTADMTGNLTNDFGETIVYDVDLSGTLYDAGGTNVIAGGVSGAVTNADFNSGQSTSVTGDFILQ